MANTTYFEEIIKDQEDKATMFVEIGRSSSSKEDSIYLKIDDKLIIMDRKTAKKFVQAVNSVGFYHGFID